MGWHWFLLENACVGCGICFDVCDFQAIRMTRDMPLPQAIPGACSGCLTCVEECPFEAIEVLDEMSLQKTLDA